MKKLATLLLAAGLVFGAATGASAIDFKAKGQFIMNFEYGGGGTGYSATRSGGDVYGYGDGTDSFEAKQRVRLQLDAVVSESLSGTVYFEMGDTTWGNGSSGGALGADGKIVELKNAYIDWVIPQTDVKVRMGIQGIALPAFTNGSSQILNSDTAGIVVSNQFTENVGLTFLWARPYNDNFGGDSSNYVPANYLDNVDIFALLLPMNFDGAKVTPWVMYTAVGQNSFRNASSLGGNSKYPLNGLLPLIDTDLVTDSGAGYLHNLYSYGSVFHAGLTGEITMADPFRFAWDFNYGSAEYGVDAVKRSGFYGSLLAEYKMDWGTPGLYMWYASGDDDDASNGSERLPSIDNSNSTDTFSHYAINGNAAISREGTLGTTFIGTWGVGVRVKDFSFMEDLKHTFRINYFGGTNSTEMAKEIRNYGYSSNAEAAFYIADGAQNIYMTTEDSALEFGLTTEYQIYENLNLIVDAAYIALWMSQEDHVWGDSFTATDAWDVKASFIYSF